MNDFSKVRELFPWRRYEEILIHADSIWSAEFFCYELNWKVQTENSKLRNNKCMACGVHLIPKFQKFASEMKRCEEVYAMFSRFLAKDLNAPKISKIHQRNICEPNKQRRQKVIENASHSNSKQDPWARPSALASEDKALGLNSLKKNLKWESTPRESSPTVASPKHCGCFLAASWHTLTAIRRPS